jgi:starch synthase
MSHLSVLAIASEAFPLIKTGGLADVVGALPAALQREGIAVRTLIPGYRRVLAVTWDATVVHTMPSLHGGAARIRAATVDGFDVLVLDAPHLFDRPGNPYVDPDRKPWPDNAQRFAALAAAGAALAHGAAAGFAPHVVHAHDWQSGLVPAYLHFGPAPRPATVMTVHNLAFQGQFPRSVFAELGLPPHAFGIDGVEYYGDVGYLKAGIALADCITTVSPTYAAEIRSPDAGMGLEGLLRTRADVLIGIRNGIDEELWDPATDAHLPVRYDATGLELRAQNKDALQARFGLARDPDALLFSIVSRLTWQKGSDLVLDALPELLHTGGQLAVLGAGDAELEHRFAAAAKMHPGRVAIVRDLNEALAHQMHGGADALLMPSRFEPCGLTQMIALRYGVVPVVARVGGLADTIVDASEMALAAGAGSGIQFAPTTREMLEAALDRTARLWRDRPLWRRVQRHAMRCDVGWRRPAREYAGLFRRLAAHAA